MNSHDAGKKKPSVQDAVARANWLARKEQGFAGLPGHGAGKHHNRKYDAEKGRGGKPPKHKQDWSAERYAEEPTLTQPLMTRPDYGTVGDSKMATDLRSKLIRLAHANPALRADILPLLAPGVDVRLASLRVKTAYAPILKSKGLNKRSYGDGMGHMLFAIDQSRNESKFYEMLIVPEGSGWKLMRRWGALTDKLGTGRISEKDMYFDNEDDAKEEMQDIYREKTTGKSKYKDAFKVSNGEYPIGLNRSVGFGHGTQSAIRCIPALKQLRSEVGEIARDVEVVKVEDHTDLLPLFNRMTAAYKTIDDRMVDGDGTMKDTLKKMMNVPLQRVVGLVQTLEKNPPRPGRPVVLDRQNLKEDLNKLYKYLDGKLSYC